MSIGDNILIIIEFPNNKSNFNFHICSSWCCCFPKNRCFSQINLFDKIRIPLNEINKKQFRRIFLDSHFLIAHTSISSTNRDVYLHRSSLFFLSQQSWDRYLVSYFIRLQPAFTQNQLNLAYLLSHSIVCDLQSAVVLHTVLFNWFA